MATNGEVFQFLLNQQRDESGLLDSGTVTFYESGTSTLKTVWTDRAKTTAAANPYTLGANGTAELYGDGVYRVVIKDSTGTTITDGDIADVEMALDTAQASATAAAASEAAAASSESLAQEWAENPEDVAVTGYPGQYSALHWAAKAVTSIIPTGTLITFGASSTPSGYLSCDGSAVSRTTYATLFGVIGTTYGIGDGTSTFNLPDLRGEFVRGWDNGRGVDSGRSMNDPQAESIASHVHPVPFHNNAGWSSNYIAGKDVSSPAGNYDTLEQTGAGTETRPRNIALHYCIKT